MKSARLYFSKYHPAKPEALVGVLGATKQEMRLSHNGLDFNRVTSKIIS
jgi:hypothetical protein